MDPNQTKYGGSTPSSICIKVDGTTTIDIVNTKSMEMKQPSSLYYYNGVVKSGSQSEKADAVNATIFSFSSPGTAEDLYTQLAAIDHPCVVEGLGHGSGLGMHSGFSFLAVTSFDTTFQAYVQKNGPATDQMGRFTEEFIKLVSDVISGMEELHIHDYYCPSLKGDDIAIVKEHNSISAKLWNFHKCKSAKAKDGDWRRLGLMLGKASRSREAMDLIGRITSGELKGMSILKDSALLTVRKKFENVLSLHLHISLHYKIKAQASMQKDNKNLQIEDLCLDNLEHDLDKRLGWNLPHWIFARSLTWQPSTLRGFITQLRNVIEHEVDYLCPEMIRKFSFKEIEDGAKRMDLEHQFQKYCGPLFRTLQRLAADLNLKY